MDDLVGLLVLVGLAILAMPVLLIVALFSLSALKRRVGVLEQRLQELQAAPQARQAPSEAPRAPAPAHAAGPATTTIAAAADAPASVQSDAGADAAAARPAVPPPIPSVPDRPAPPPRRPSTQEMPPQWRQPAPAPRDPEPGVFDIALRAIRRWFTVGNVPVKIGVLVLFAGVAALLKYASDQGLFSLPLELRLAAIAAAALAALAFAWRKRESNRAFALSLQGGAIGVLLLTVFAAFKLHTMLPVELAFGLSIVLVAGAGMLAVLQDARALAVLALLAGFLAPIWLSTGSGNHVALFSYYAILNAAIFAVAWFKSWRVLNLLGFAFTFGIGTLWGAMDYQPHKFASTEPFLLLFFAFYLLIPLLYLRRLPEGRRDFIDGCLVFGTPLVAFSLQAALLEGARMPLAFNALGLGALYAALAWWLLRRMRTGAALGQSYALLAVGFATLAVPLALSARATASVFALEGAALVWLGLRQRRRLPQASGIALQLLAALAFLAGSGAAADAIANPAFMSALLIALAGLGSAWSYRERRLDLPALLFYLWGLAWWLGNGLHEIGRFVAWDARADAALALIALTGWLAAETHRRRPAAALAATTLLGLAAAVPLALLQSDAHGQPFAGHGAWAWLAYAVLGVRSLICLRASGHRLAAAAQGVWWLVWPFVISLLLLWLCDRQALAEGWRWLAVASPWCVLAAVGLLRWPWLAAPLGERFDGWRPLLLGLYFLVLAVGWPFSLLAAGDSAPLPWLPLLNPLELAQAATLALAAHWLWSGHAPGMLRDLRVVLLSVAGFLLVTSITLHAVHHWGGIAWNEGLLSTSLAQTSLTVVWSALGVMGWVLGSRRGQRTLWLAGAVLMAVVLGKLLLIDRGNLGDVLGIASFIAYGLLCTGVGYLAPAPPRNPGEINA